MLVLRLPKRCVIINNNNNNNNSRSDTEELKGALEGNWNSK